MRISGTNLSPVPARFSAFGGAGGAGRSDGYLTTVGTSFASLVDASRIGFDINGRAVEFLLSGGSAGGEDSDTLLLN